MKYEYTFEEVEAWRSRVQGRLVTRSLCSTHSALNLINDIGFCFALNSEHSDYSCLEHESVANEVAKLPGTTGEGSSLSLVRALKDVLPSEGKSFYGRILQGRPTVASLEFFTYFYALRHRLGSRSEYATEFQQGKLSFTAKKIMDALTRCSPQTTPELKISSKLYKSSDGREFDRGLRELQGKMFIVKVVNRNSRLSLAWETITRQFPKETKRARTTADDVAHERILQKYFQNQLVGTVLSIQRLFKWEKQSIFRALGNLKRKGIISSDVVVDGTDGKYYGLVQ